MPQENPLYEAFLKDPLREFVFTGGHRFTKGVSKADVCLVTFGGPYEELYKVMCVAFEGEDKKNPMQPGEIRYVPNFGLYAYIPNPTESLEERGEKLIVGEYRVVREDGVYMLDNNTFNAGKKINEYPKIDSGGHPDIDGMSNEHPRRENGRAVFNAVIENGNIRLDQSYTIEQMRKGRIPHMGNFLTFFYPESYESAFRTPAQLEELKSRYNIDPATATWNQLKEYPGLDWSAGIITSLGKVVPKFSMNKPFTRMRGATLITVGRGVSATSPEQYGRWVVGDIGANTQFGNLVANWDETALKGIRGGPELLKEIDEYIIRKRPEKPVPTAVQILLGTIVDKGQVIGVDPANPIIEYLYWTEDPEDKWGIQ